jgi:hypothetical protein
MKHPCYLDYISFDFSLRNYCRSGGKDLGNGIISRCLTRMGRYINRVSREFFLNGNQKIEGDICDQLYCRLDITRFRFPIPGVSLECCIVSE